ncbi:MAG: hypothetical protein RL591_2559 [Planctomycetota bacterium]
MNLALPSPEVMPHETSRFVRHHPLALHFVPRSCLSARNLLRNWLALATATSYRRSFACGRSLRFAMPNTRKNSGVVP